MSLSDPESTIREYASAFATLQPDAVVPFYATPCTFVSPQGSVIVPDATSAGAMAKALIESAAKQGYAGSNLADVQTFRLGEGLAMVRGVFIRLDQSGAEITRFGFIYLLRLVDSQWKITVAVAHDPPARS